MNKFLLAAVQLNSQQDKEENLKKMEKYIIEAAEKGAKVIAFPEGSNYIGDDSRQVAEKIPGGKTFKMISELAKKYSVWIHAGSIYEDRDGEIPYNCNFLVGPDGELKTKYRKLHPFDVDVLNGPSIRESNKVHPGDEVVTFDTKDYGHFGLSICYDMRFPELYRLMTLKGANILFVPANFTMNTGKDHWEPILRTRAIENGCYVVAPAQIGQKPTVAAYGKTIIIDPWGNIIAKSSDREGVILTEIDLDYVEEIRRKIGTLKNRRIDIYKVEEI